MARFYALPAALCFATLAACGGNDGGRPSGEPIAETPALDPCDVAVGFEFQNVVDFEPPPGSVPDSTRVQDCGEALPCSFNFNFDVANTPPGTGGALCPDVETFTNPGMQGFLTGTPAGTRCNETEYATRVVERNLAVCTNTITGRRGWGGSMSLSFNVGTESIDASEWDGFSFWVKKASSATGSAIIAASVDLFTSGMGNTVDPITGEARSCDASGLTIDEAGEPIPDSDKCDGFGVTVSLTDDWTFVSVRFADMRQKGFGMPSPVGRVLSEELVRVQFLMSAGDWDFWIDDVAFFREPSR